MRSRALPNLRSLWRPSLLFDLLAIQTYLEVDATRFTVVNRSQFGWNLMLHLSYSRCLDMQRLRDQLSCAMPMPSQLLILSIPSPWLPLSLSSSTSPLPLAPPLSSFQKSPLPPSPPQDQWTPLHWASSRGHEATCRVLIEAGAEVDA